MKTLFENLQKKKESLRDYISLIEIMSQGIQHDGNYRLYNKELIGDIPSEIMQACNDLNQIIEFALTWHSFESLQATNILELIKTKNVKDFRDAIDTLSKIYTRTYDIIRNPEFKRLDHKRLIKEIKGILNDSIE